MKLSKIFRYKDLTDLFWQYQENKGDELSDELSDNPRITDLYKEAEARLKKEQLRS